MPKRMHTVPHDEGASRAGSVHAAQVEAVNAARDTAIGGQAGAVIRPHRGGIRKADSSGNDPFPRRGFPKPCHPGTAFF